MGTLRQRPPTKKRVNRTDIDVEQPEPSGRGGGEIHVLAGSRIPGVPQHNLIGVLGEADEVLGDDFDDPRFLGPGAPRAAWLGITLSFR